MCLYNKFKYFFNNIRYFLFPVKLSDAGFDKYKEFFISWAKLGVGTLYKENHIRKKVITNKYFEDLVNKGYLIEDDENSDSNEKDYFLSFSMYPIINLWEQEKINRRNEFNTKLIIKLTFFSVFSIILLGIFDAIRYMGENQTYINIKLIILIMIFFLMFLLYFIFFDKSVFIPPKDDDIDKPIDSKNFVGRIKF